ncbi:helix-turn-helix transcriptional regulator [Cohnella zeiphila]|uniref:helix-turn-helix transcriptional regulator n=1 Tax=Cohnella zeiphila TaxID=2761120 RepID=UPI002356B1F5|nr:helix-turn-helix transcriptional regulator [Cohnella zeiphila]
MTDTGDQGRLEELAQFLRTRRERMSPAEAGFPEGGRRRTPGLRRQEVAQLAGMSVDWYTWMEQARPIQVSAQVIESLAKVLRLDASERKHLYLLALRQLPADSELSEQEDGRIGETLQKLLDLQGSCPAMVLNQRMNAVGWNRAARNVYGDYEKMSGRERNVVWRTFTDPAMKLMLREGWEAQARRRLAQLRAHYANFAGDPWWTALIADLNEASPEFREWWPRHDVLGAPEGNKILHHPIVGQLAFDHISFSPSDAPELTVTVNIPLPEFDTAAKLRMLHEQ